MNNLKVFENREFGQVRTVVINNEPYFVGKDIADALGYGNSRQALKTNIDVEDKDVHTMEIPSGKQREFRRDKSQYSAHECDTWVYFDAVMPEFERILGIEVA